jgi:hypothetical protein
VGTQRARRGAGARARALLSGRPHPHRAGLLGAAAAAAVRVGPLPALRARPRRLPPPSARRGSRSAGVRRRLHLRGPGTHRPHAAPFRRRGADARAVPQPPRTSQACQPPGRGPHTNTEERASAPPPPGRPMLGAAQERWFADGLAAAPERWNFIAQQTPMARAGVMIGGRRRFPSDRWDGYPAARDRLLGGDRRQRPAQLRRAQRRRALRVRRRPRARPTRSSARTRTSSTARARAAATWRSTSPQSSASRGCA